MLKSLFDKVAGLQAYKDAPTQVVSCQICERPATLLKRDSNTCFPVKSVKFLRTPILKNVCERLLLS